MYAYQSPDAAITLREGLTQFRTLTGLEEKMNGVSAEARALMDRHDIVHVVFGLDTSLRQEAIVDIWTLFGTTARPGELLDYLRLPEERAIIAEIGWWRIFVTTLKAVPDMFRVAAAARRLKKKWPWRGHEALLDRRLDHVRQEFGVTLLAA